MSVTNTHCSFTTLSRRGARLLEPVAAAGDLTAANGFTATVLQPGDIVKAGTAEYVRNAANDGWEVMGLGRVSHIFPGVLAVSGNDGDCLVGATSGTAGDSTATEAAATECKVSDGGVFADLSVTAAEAGYTNNYQIFPDTAADNDAVYFGNAIPFCELHLDMSATVCTYTGDALTWEYYDGSAWSALTIIADGTGSAGLGVRAFNNDGFIAWVPPEDWAATAVDSVTKYWVRARITTIANLVVDGGVTNSKEHEVVTPTTGLRIPVSGTILSLQLVDQASTVHTTADVKFVLFNFTKGTYSKSLTFAQDLREVRVEQAGLTTAGDGVAVDAGDLISLLAVQEDGTNEVTNPMVILGLGMAA